MGICLKVTTKNKIFTMENVSHVMELPKGIVADFTLSNPTVFYIIFHVGIHFTDNPYISVILKKKKKKLHV